jgi:hypothetical protein
MPRSGSPWESPQPSSDTSRGENQSNVYQSLYSQSFGFNIPESLERVQMAFPPRKMDEGTNNDYLTASLEAKNWLRISYALFFHKHPLGDISNFLGDWRTHILILTVWFRPSAGSLAVRYTACVLSCCTAGCIAVVVLVVRLASCIALIAVLFHCRIAV